VAIDTLVVNGSFHLHVSWLRAQLYVATATASRSPWRPAQWRQHAASLHHLQPEPA